MLTLGVECSILLDLASAERLNTKGVLLSRLQCDLTR